MVLADPPYGTTACKWDSIIPLEPMWEQLKRAIKPNGAIVMTASQPFTTTLINSNIKMFRYEWIWEKHKGTNYCSAKKRPLKIHENILVFGGKKYNPQMTKGKGYKPSASHHVIRGHSIINANKRIGYSVGFDPNKRYPVSIQRYSNHNQKKNCFHPTQKPVPLMEYLIKTYTDEGETVLDFTMGSGTTGVACVRTGRNFIGIEKEPKYYEIAQKRIQDEKERFALLETA